VCVWSDSIVTVLNATANVAQGGPLVVDVGLPSITTLAVLFVPMSRFRPPSFSLAFLGDPFDHFQRL